MLRQFSEHSASRIARAVRWAEKHYGDRLLGQRQQPTAVYRFLIGKTDGSGITARSGSTVGTGTVTLYYIDPDTDALTVKQDRNGDDVTVTVKNMSTTAVAASAYVQIGQEHMKGTYLAVWEDC